jgi:hypothetical protein
MPDMISQIPTLPGRSIGDTSLDFRMPVNDQVNSTVWFSNVVYRSVYCIVCCIMSKMRY